MSIFSWITGKKVEAKEKELTKLQGEFETVLGERNSATSELRKVKDELEDLKLKKKIEEEDIKHLTKIKLEQNEIEFTKKVMQVEKTKDSEVMTLKQEYADKLQVRLENEVKNIKEMYSEILKRIPDVNVRLQGKV